MSAVIFAVVQEPGDWLFQPGELGSCFSNTRIAVPFARSVVFEEKREKEIFQRAKRHGHGWNVELAIFIAWFCSGDASRHHVTWQLLLREIGYKLVC